MNSFIKKNKICLKGKLKRLSLDNFLLTTYLSLISIIITTKFYAVTLDIIFITFLLAALLVKKAKTFVKDWLPLVILFLCYELMRSFADNLNQRVHIHSLITVEKLLFKGKIPTIVLQQTLYQGHLGFIEHLSVFFYLSHFYASLTLAFILWLKNRSLFKIFIKGFLLLSFAGLMTFILYPAMPPWLASYQGHLPKIHRIIIKHQSAYFSGKTLLGFFYAFVASLINSSPNLVAAMPSLHSAWPFYTSLFLIHYLGKKYLLTLILPLGVWFSIIYLGEHYVIDILAGILYAAVSLIFTKKLFIKPNIN